MIIDHHEKKANKYDASMPEMAQAVHEYIKFAQKDGQVHCRVHGIGNNYSMIPLQSTIHISI